MARPKGSSQAALLRNLDAEPRQIVLDDAAVGRPIGLSEYFDRSYLRKLAETASQAKRDSQAAAAIVLRRHSSYASRNLLSRLWQMAGPLEKQTTVQFARDYSFRALKTNNVILLGNSRSNPWIEPFESRLGLRWAYHEALGVYYPVDSWASPSERDRFRMTAEPGEPREGYCIISLAPNLGGTGNVLITLAQGRDHRPLPRPPRLKTHSHPGQRPQRLNLSGLADHDVEK